MREHVETHGRRRAGATPGRLDTLEAASRERLHKALVASHEQLVRLDRALAKVSRDDWSTAGVARRLEGLRARAEKARASAMKRVNEMPASAVSAIAQGTRVPVQNLARELQKLARLVEPRDEARRPGGEAAASRDGKAARVVRS